VRIQTHYSLKALGVRLVVLTAAMLATSGFGSGERLFAPSSDLWDMWSQHDPSSATVVDHSLWDDFLTRNIVQTEGQPNSIAYGAVSTADRATLGQYINSLSQMGVHNLSQSSQKAFWINLYNALTVKIVIDHYPVKSIRDIDISPGLFAVGPWGRTLITVEGQSVSLNDIEHRILRPIWRDPRIHYAVNCASIGCPDLAARAYRAETLDLQLDEAARRYVNSDRGVAFRRDQITVSKIYYWFIEDFGGSEANVLAHLRQFADSALLEKLEPITLLEEVQYDWALNDTRP
jgi:hypothetical protein